MDWIIGSGIAAFVMYATANWQLSDKQKIKHVFENVEYRVRDKTPKLIRTYKTEQSTQYTYNVPFGLIDDPKLHVIEKTLNKPTVINFDKGKLHIKVYHEKLKKRYVYDQFKETGGWTIPVGMSYDGPVYHDFDQLPHMIVSGTTTWGKTVFMRTLMVHLIENHPDDAEFYVLDLKGGLAFNPYRNLKQVKAVAGDYKESARVLRMVKKRIKEDMEYLKSIEAENAKEGNISSRKFILVDEAGELKPDSSMSDSDKACCIECQNILSHIARVAGQIGYKLIFGTQYPTKEILNPQIKANAVARVSFRLTTSVQSGVAIDQSGAELLEYPGRAIYKTVDEHLVQTPFIDKQDIKNRLKEWFEDDTARTTETAGREDHVSIG